MYRPSVLEEPKPSLLRPVPHDSVHWPPVGTSRSSLTLSPVAGLISSRYVTQPLGRLFVHVVTWVHKQMPSVKPQGHVVVQVCE